MWLHVLPGVAPHLRLSLLCARAPLCCCCIPACVPALFVHHALCLHPERGRMKSHYFVTHSEAGIRPPAPVWTFADFADGCQSRA